MKFSIDWCKERLSARTQIPDVIKKNSDKLDNIKILKQTL